MSVWWLAVAFVCGLFAGSVLFEWLYRLKGKAADELIETQRRWIAYLEADRAHLEEFIAQGDGNPKGGDSEAAPSRSDDSPVAAGDAPIAHHGV